MKIRNSLRFPAIPMIATLVACLTVGALPARAANETPIESFTAFAASLGTGRAAIVDITLFRWSTDQEREALLAALQESGRDTLVDALHKIKPRVGYVRTPNSIGYDLYYAREHKAADGSRRIVLATDRRVSFREVMSDTRSMDYRVTVFELRIGADGRGEGKLVPAAKITWDKTAGKIEIANYSALPVDLLQVSAKKPGS